MGWAGLTVLVGFAAGILSGMFGVGGGLLTTPALRLLLGAPALVAVGTPLPVIIPTAAAGAYSYLKRDLADLRGGLTVGAWGALAAVIGAYLSSLAGGSVVMFATAALILVMAADMLLQAVRGDTGKSPALSARHPRRGVAMAILGVVTGLYSGFLGLGGGFVLVPLLTRWFGYSIKRAIGTSLVAITVLAIPGSITHLYLGHVDLRLTALLMIGVVPGALVGAKLTSIASDRAVRLGFAALLVLAGVALAWNELAAVSS